MASRSAVISNDPVAEEAAQNFLMSGGGSAIGAVLCGFFAAAGAYAGVLLGPVTVLVGGVGSGARVFDGRMRQPGIGAKRPRGFTPEETIPDAARAAVPAGVAAALVAHAYDGRQGIASILKPGLSRAERSGADARADLLKRIRAAGAGALSEPAFVRAMLRVAGPAQGGLLTPSDFERLANLDQVATEQRFGDGAFFEAPWAQEMESVSPNLGIGFAVCAIDVRGTFAALCYRRVTDGLALDDIELEVPFLAVPVERGVTRVAPGAPLPAPAPIAIRCNASGVPVEVVAAPMAARLDTALSARPLLSLSRDPETTAVSVQRKS